MSLRQNITKHYQSAIGGDLQSVEISEWDQTVYFKKTHSFQEEAKIIELQSQGKVVEALVETVLVKSRDKDGKRLFADADRDMLMREADPKVITKICAAINSAELRMDMATASKE